ncbi:hypothetical protein ZIOFF_053846 [Zingiber officinale]|uniref:J domain-containing protein n=1 Tax=Zingiber officinale TaxID=94328 RepID=A0A8J5KD78_ZINOF|nr:hypothetical protein ZIOFF_053846 [Zingiber officinale]
MECNKDEALRAKAIAEKKFMEKDYMGAKKFALKAQNLFPAFEGVIQLISTLDVYIASEHKANGENDWYSILRVSSTADEDTVKKQYRKLALLLHPDKNKSVGAEGAFKLISEAWSVLSDKSRRMLYDQKVQKSFQPTKNQTVPGNFNGFYKFSKNTVKAHMGNGSTRVVSATTNPSHKPSAPETFWTSCNKCNMQYEYLKVYLNHTLLCPSCHEPFLAKETKSPSNQFVNSVPISQQSQPNDNHSAPSKNASGQVSSNSMPQGKETTGLQNGANPGSFTNSNFQWRSFSRSAGVASATASSAAAAQAANVVHQTYEKVRRKREEAQAAARRDVSLRRKNNALKKNTNPSGAPNAGQSVDIRVTQGRGISHDPGSDKRAVLTQQFHSSGTNEVGGNCGDLLKTRMAERANNPYIQFCLFNTRKMWIEMTKSAIKEKLKEWKSTASMKPDEKENVKKKQKLCETGKDEGKDVAHGDATGQKQTLEPQNDTIQCLNENKPPNFQSTESDDETNEPMSIDVPDADFHDFDNDRSEKAFRGDEIWATYDDEDGMPRYYALVQKVITLNPFKIRFSFLTSKSNSEFGPLNWVASGFPKSCGDFRIGRYEVTDTINIFSHKVTWEKGPRGIIKIVPRKGETWALYRNWSPEWNEHTPDDVIYKYDMVEVLEDYNEEHGVSIIPLVKISEFRTVFSRNTDPKQIKRIQKEEMFRFSHQVPSHLLTGEEAENSPKGYFELDPAATPLELLQIIKDSKTEAVAEAIEPTDWSIPTWKLPTVTEGTRSPIPSLGSLLFLVAIRHASTMFFFVGSKAMVIDSIPFCSSCLLHPPSSSLPICPSIDNFSRIPLHLAAYKWISADVRVRFADIYYCFFFSLFLSDLALFCISSFHFFAHPSHRIRVFWLKRAIRQELLLRDEDLTDVGFGQSYSRHWVVEDAQGCAVQLRMCGEFLKMCKEDAQPLREALSSRRTSAKQ